MNAPARNLPGGPPTGPAQRQQWRGRAEWVSGWVPVVMMSGSSISSLRRISLAHPRMI